MAKQDFYSRLVMWRRNRLFGWLAYYLLKLLGAEIPRSVQVGEGFCLVHGGFGVVLHPTTVVGKSVKVYPGVTVGRADIYRPASESAFERVVIGDDVVLSPGAKVLGREGTLVVGDRTVVGANAVLLESTGADEVWAGVPARRVGARER